MDIHLYNPYDKQKEVHKACNDKSTFFVTVSAGRQVGKSLLGINQSLYWALSESKKKIYWVSPTSSQCQKIYQQTLTAVIGIKGDGLVKSYKGTQGDTEILFNNGSVIKYRSALQDDNLRGEDIHYMICDEMSYIKQSTFEGVLLGMMTVLGRKVLSLSTPKGKNHFYYSYLKGQNPLEPKYKSFKFTSSDNPYANPEIIKLAKESLPEKLYSQEFLAEFVDGTAIFENIDLLCNLKPITAPLTNEKLYCGVDIAQKNDWCVVSIFNTKNEMVYMDRFTDVSAPALKQRLMNTFERFKPAKIYIEANNQGLPIIDDLQLIHKVKNIVPFQTTATSKPRIINNLINAFASKSITLLDDNDLITELEAFTMTYSHTGKAQFAAAQGFHDDIVMSIAIAYEALNKNQFNGKYIFM